MILKEPVPLDDQNFADAGIVMALFSSGDNETLMKFLDSLSPDRRRAMAVAGLTMKGHLRLVQNVID